LWIAGLMSQREKILLEHKIYKNKNEFDLYKNFFSNKKIDINKKNILNINDNLVNESLHSKELLNWINFMKNSN